MSKVNPQELQKREAQDLAEQTREGRVFTPNADIFERDEVITVLADMPGVTPGNLTIDLREGVLTLTGRVESPQSPKEEEVLREYEVGTFFRQFALPEAVDQAKIDARLTDGVVRLELPKAEAARPRRITVKTT